MVANGVTHASLRHRYIVLEPPPTGPRPRWGREARDPSNPSSERRHQELGPSYGTREVGCVQAQPLRGERALYHSLSVAELARVNEMAEPALVASSCLMQERSPQGHLTAGALRRHGAWEPLHCLHRSNNPKTNEWRL